MRLAAVAGAGWLAASSAVACDTERTSSAEVEDTAASNDASGDPPRQRSEPQLPAAELETVLAAARPLVAAHDVTAAVAELRRCANKLPPSGECEALLAIVLLEHRVQPAHAYYYLAEVVAEDRPDVSTEQLHELARLATAHGRFADAERALAILRARGNTTEHAAPGVAQALF